MKIPIKKEQFDKIQELNSKRSAVAETLCIALARAEDKTEHITEETNIIWEDIIEEHGLSDLLDWEITIDDGIPYVASVDKK